VSQRRYFFAQNLTFVAGHKLHAIASRVKNCKKS